MLMHNTLLKKFIVLLVITLLCSLTFINAVKFYALLTEKKALAHSTSPLSIKYEKKNTPTVQMITRWQIFGKNKPKSKKVIAPKTKLNLNLIGIISSTKDSQARAIIELSSRVQKYYKIGDKIKKNIEIRAINTDHIVIVHNSQEEILPLKSLQIRKDIIKRVIVK